MSHRKVYEALARGQPVEAILPDLTQSLGAEACVLYFAGQTEAWVAFRRASFDLLEAMRDRLVDELQTAMKSTNVPVALPEHVELALSEENLAQLETIDLPSPIDIHLIRFGDELVGGLALVPTAVQGKEDGGRDSAGLEQVLAALGFAHRIEGARRTSEEMQGCLERIAMVGRVFAESHLLDRTLARLLEIAVGLVGASVGVIAVKASPDEKPIPPASWGFPPDWIDALRFREGGRVLDQVLENGQACYLRTTEALDAASMPKFLVSLAAVPLTCEGGTVGCMCIANPPVHFFETSVERRALSALASLTGSAIRNSRRMEAEIRSERLREEVRLAAHVQTSLLPRQLPDNNRLEAAAVVRLASHLGGDFYDVFDLGKGRWGVMIADVSGKGSSGAILMATARAYLHAFAREGSSPAEVLERMNQSLVQDFTDGRFLTATYLIVDLTRHRIQMAGAGHHPVFLIKKDGEITCLPSDDLPLGISMDTEFSEISKPLEGGTTILLYTDGLVEASSTDGRFFGAERMLMALSRAPATSAKEVIHHLLDEVQTWTQSATFVDDLTILAIRVK
jgi:serine phosphatase RsbU (regulator of sigma subunit)